MKIVIIGGGFGGMAAAQALKKVDAEIVLLDRSNHHLFQPLLYQVATAALPISHIACPLRQVFKHQSNTTVLMENVINIDTDSRTVHTDNGKLFAYDYLIIAPGARHSYFGHDQWEHYAPGLKTAEDASRIREILLTAFERAERCDDPIKAKRYLNFAIIGAGPTGVEVAGSLAELTRDTMIRNFRHIKPEESKIYLIEGLGQVLPAFPKKLSDKAHRELEKCGITILLNTKVTDVSSHGLKIGDQLLDIPTIIWAAGNQASPLLNTLGVPLDKNGRVLVNQDLSIPKDSQVFVIGDAAAVKDKEGHFLPAIAPAAIQQGRYVANLIKKNIASADRKPFAYFDKGMIATIGRGRAVALLRKFQFSGIFAWLIWGLVHIMYLVNFENRLLVMIQWIFLYFTGSRSDRIIRHANNKHKDN